MSKPESKDQIAENLEKIFSMTYKNSDTAKLRQKAFKLVYEFLL